MKLLRAVLPALIFGMIMFMPHPAFAADANFFGPIWPADKCSCPGKAPAWGCILLVLENLMNVGISIGVIIFVLVCAYAGVLFMSSSFNAHAREMARTMLLNAVIGLVIALSAWLLVDFIMKIVYDPSSAKFGPWNEILAGGDGDYCVQATITAVTLPGDTGGGKGLTAGNPPKPTTTGTGLLQADAQARLTAAGVNISSTGSCSDKSNPHCTSLAGMQASTVQQIINIENACKRTNSSCVVTVSGGTEAGHDDGTYSHGNGYKVDISDRTPGINAFFNSLNSTGARGGDHGGAIYTDSCGNQYVHEDAYHHWDITITNPCTSF